MTESAIGKKILLIASKMGHRLFRMNSGMAWNGKIIHFTKTCTVTLMPGDIVIRQAYPIRFGMEGMTDYGGWTKDGKALWTEIKIPGHHTSKDRLEKQQNFIDAVKAAGGVSGFCESEEDFIKLFS